MEMNGMDVENENSELPKSTEEETQLMMIVMLL